MAITLKDTTIRNNTNIPFDRAFRREVANEACARARQNGSFVK